MTPKTALLNTLYTISHHHLCSQFWEPIRTDGRSTSRTNERNSMPPSVFSEYINIDSLTPTARLYLAAIEARFPSHVNLLGDMCVAMTRSNMPELCDGVIHSYFQKNFSMTIDERSTPTPIPAKTISMSLPDTLDHIADLSSSTVLNVGAPSWAAKAKAPPLPAPFSHTSRASSRSTVGSPPSFECPEKLAHLIGDEGVAMLASIHTNHGIPCATMFSDEIFDDHLIKTMKLAGKHAAVDVIAGWAKAVTEIRNPRNWMQKALDSMA